MFLFISPFYFYGTEPLKFGNCKENDFVTSIPTKIPHNLFFIILLQI